MSEPPAIPRVVVVGGGISGLSTANHLLEESRRVNFPVELQLLEASDRLGGVIQTSQRDGFTLEGGPDSFISDKPWALRLCERLGLQSQLIGTSEAHRRSFVVRKGHLEPVPDGFYLLAPTRMWPLITTPIFSWPGKLRMAADLVLPAKSRDTWAEDESLASFVRRRLGREALERIAQPMIGGIYTSDPEELSLLATMPRLLEMEREHRSVILALWKQRRSSQRSQAAGPRYGLFVSMKQGMQELIEHLGERLPDQCIQLNSKVRSLDFEGRRWRLNLANGSSIVADAICLALAAHQMVPLLKPLDCSLADQLGEIHYASTATINLAYRLDDVPQRLDGFGFVVPAAEKREILACTFSHVKFSGRAPQNGALFRAFMGGALQPQAFDHDDREMVRIVRQNLAELLGLRTAPLFTQVERHPLAMAQYAVGHLKRVSSIDEALSRWPSLHLAGNAFTGVGIPDCIRRGEACAAEMVRRLSVAHKATR
jgi:oxygen-dependent protoporphyrinogen oxidase